MNRTIQPPTTEIGELKIQEALKHKLDNGISVYSVNAGVQDLVRVELIFPENNFNPLEPLLTSSSCRMMNEGTSKHNAQQLADMIDYFGAFYETEQTADYCSVIVFTLNKHLEKTLPVLFEILTDAAFPEYELGIYKQNNKQRLMIENEKVASVARRKFGELIFGAQHSYGYQVQPHDYDNLLAGRLKSFHRSHYSSAHCTMIVSGMVGETSIALLNKYFGGNSWSSSNGVQEKIISSQSAAEKKYFIAKEGAVQSAVRIGKLMFNKTNPDYAAFTVLNTIIGGYFGSRLMANIREEKGYTYGIGSAIASMKQDGYFFISTEVGADVCTAAIDEVYKEIETLKREPVGKEELSIVKNYMLGNFIKGIDGAFNLADRFKGIWLYGLGYDYYYNYLSTLKKITAEELMLLANKYFDRDTFTELIVGKI